MELDRLSAGAANDVFSLSIYGPKFVGRWDGSRWHNIPVPAPMTSGDGAVWAILADGSVGAWLGGSKEIDTTTGQYQAPSIFRWDGATWTDTLPSWPNSSGGSAEITTLVESSVSDVWAGGWVSGAGTPNGYEPLVLHWNGATWTQQSDASPPGSLIEWLSARSSTDVWAAGTDSDDVHGYVEHFDGHAWSLSGYNGPSVSRIVAAEDGTVWVLASSASVRSALYRLRSGRWTEQSIPPDIASEGVNQIAVDPRNDLWVAGSVNRHSAIAFLHGDAWTFVGHPADPYDTGGFEDITFVGNNSWVVGYSQMVREVQTIPLAEVGTQVC